MGLKFCTNRCDIYEKIPSHISLFVLAFSIKIIIRIPRLILGGKYVAASGFTPDVKVWSVKFNKSGGFEKAQRAFELTGHTSGIFHFTWRNDSARVATISKDGTWRLYNVELDLHLGMY